MTAGPIPVEALCPATGLVCDFRVETIESRDYFQVSQLEIVDFIEEEERFNRTLPGMLVNSKPMNWILNRIMGPPPNPQGTLVMAQRGITDANDTLRASCTGTDNCGSLAVHKGILDRRNSETTN